jgi:hypothetical protein
MVRKLTASEKRSRRAFSPCIDDVMNALLQRICMSLMATMTARARGRGPGELDDIFAALRHGLPRNRFDFLNSNVECDLIQLEEMFNTVFSTLVDPPHTVTIDEQMIGRDDTPGAGTAMPENEEVGSQFSMISWVTFMPRKPTSSGYLRYVLATTLHNRGAGKISYVWRTFTCYNRTMSARDCAVSLVSSLRQMIPPTECVYLTVDSAFGGYDLVCDLLEKGVFVTAACPSTTSLVQLLFSGLAKTQYRVMEKPHGAGCVTLFAYRDNGDMACATSLTAKVRPRPMFLTADNLKYLHAGGVDFLKNLLRELNVPEDNVVGLSRLALLSSLVQRSEDELRPVIEPPTDPNAGKLATLKANTTEVLKEMCKERLLPTTGDKSTLAWRLVDNPHRLEDQSVEGILAQFRPEAGSDKDKSFPFWKQLYKDTFNYIDIVDRKCSELQYPHKMARPTAAVLWSFFHNAVVNAHALYWARTGQHRNIKDWALELLRAARLRHFRAI